MNRRYGDPTIEPPSPKPRPPRPKYLSMRYVTWDQYHDIWPNELGSVYPTSNPEYPPSPPGWLWQHDTYFCEWLLEKNITPQWFHQDSCLGAKEELLCEFVRQWDGLDECPLPKRSLRIRNYGGHRDMFYNPQSVNRPLVYMKFFVDWLRYGILRLID